MCRVIAVPTLVVLLGSLASSSSDASRTVHSAPLRGKDYIHAAVVRGDADVVATFIFSGVDPDLRDEDGLTPLQLAAYSGHVGVARVLLKAGADVNAPRKSGDTALHIAAERGHRELLEALIAAGADVNAISTLDHWAPTPLALAVGNRRADCVQALLEAGADLDAAEGGGARLLFSAGAWRSPEIAQMLVDHGAEHTLHSAAGIGDTVALRRLLDAGADPDALDEYNRMAPLHWAAQTGQAESIALLVAAGADTEARSGGTDVTPLHEAVFRNHPDAARVLLEGGADANSRMGGGWRLVGSGSHLYSYYRPLHIAAYQGRPEMVRLLLEHGADPNGRAVLPEPVPAWIRDPRDPTRGPSGPGMGRLELLWPPGLTPLHVAARMAGSDYGRQFHRRFGWTWAELMEMLIEAGAEVDARDGFGRTPLHSAGPEEAPVLLAGGADVNVTDLRGATPLHRAAAVGDLALVELLLNAGAAPDMQDAQGRTPLAVAEANERWRVISALRDWAARQGAVPDEG